MNEHERREKRAQDTEQRIERGDTIEDSDYLMWNVISTVGPNGRVQAESAEEEEPECWETTSFYVGDLKFEERHESGRIGGSDWNEFTEVPYS